MILHAFPIATNMSALLLSYFFGSSTRTHAHTHAQTRCWRYWSTEETTCEKSSSRRRLIRTGRYSGRD